MNNKNKIELIKQSWMFHLFKRNKSDLPNDPKTLIKSNFKKQLDVHKYHLPNDTTLPKGMRNLTVEKLIRKRKIAPIYPSEEPYCEDDKMCMICFQTVRQGMNTLKCCKGKRFICTLCLLFHPKFNLERCELYCDVCQVVTKVYISEVDIDREITKIMNQPKEENNEIGLLEIIKKSQGDEPKTIPFANVHKEIIDKFKELGVEMRSDISADAYNLLDINKMTDPDMAIAMMVSLC
ncbi:hypothetical protein EDI_190120 [Entamoeba dispar SAW760]|uniref:RING-type domain-containing protein n=1 Tax=Entamoeba dispar (strain ATCC PRA-260 / SAW760) TaxID=370354 RepID=B0EMN9_ENTDS|nr:uncharacterized protein EDI_190120 [Entamoeba dispar SAW760]EDR24204.1 hypothetical protein EDI_190120 [Entamoeba dispar SAW760]|eukprot:EDR24204.1 hypothetical protein EDI_190120 [Entamoeba dispar SAW760]